MKLFIDTAKDMKAYELFTIQKSIGCGYGIWYKNTDLLELSYSDNPDEFNAEFWRLIRALHLEDKLNEILKNHK